MKVLCILNGSKSQSLHFQHVISKMKNVNHEFHFSVTKYKGHAIEIAEKSASLFDAIVPAGGDGTVSECVNGLMLFTKAHPDKTLPLVLPIALGSGNDYVRNFSWKHDVNALLDRLQNPHSRSIDVAQVTFSNRVTTFFNNASSAGFGPSVVRLTEKMPSKWPGNLKFGLAILIAFFTYRKKFIHIVGDDFTWSGKAMIAVVSKGKYFGSGIGIAPDAKTDDGFLHVTIVGNVSLLDYLLQLKTLKQCKKISHQEVFYFKSKKVEFRSNSRLESDGELKHEAHCSFSVIPGAIKFA